MSTRKPATKTKAPKTTTTGAKRKAASSRTSGNASTARRARAPASSSAPPSSSAASGARHVVLLRGVNVGGNNRVPMEELRALIAEAGGADVETYINSGNAVFSGSDAVVRGMASTLAALLTRRLKVTVPVVVRSARELAAAIAANPFPQAEANHKALHVAFLAARPSPDQARALDPNRSPPDELRLVGQELYLWLKGGVAGTRITVPWVDSTLGTVSTWRNWRTVLTLAELAAGAGPQRT